MADYDEWAVLKALNATDEEHRDASQFIGWYINNNMSWGVYDRLANMYGVSGTDRVMFVKLLRKGLTPGQIRNKLILLGG